MQKRSLYKSGVFNPRVLLTFALCSVGVLLGMLSVPAPARLNKTTVAIPNTFEKAYDGGGEDSGFSLLKDADGNFLALGDTSSFGAGNGDMFLQKTDGQGKLLWAKSYGGADLDEGLHVASTSDQGYILAGRSYSFGAGNEDAYLVKTDRDGNLQWSKVYGTPKIERSYSVRQTSDGGYILSGSSLNYQNTPIDFTVNNFDVLLIKTTAVGNLVWAKRYDGLFNEEGHDVEQTPDGGYIVTGVALRDSSTQLDNTLLMKTDGDGNVQWANAYGGAYQSPGWTVRQLNGGGFIISGWANTNGDCHMLKVDSGGAVLWDKSYAGPNNDLCYSAESTSDGGFLLAGSTGSFGAGSFDGYLVKTDGAGNLQWSRAYGGSGVEFGTVGVEANDGGYVLSGLTRSFSAAGDLYLVKTDANGNSGCHDVPAATAVGVLSPRVTPLNFTVTDGGIAMADAATQVGNGPTETMENTLCASVPLPYVTSRKSHGSAGTFDVDLALDGSGIECRSGGVNDEYTIVFTFANTLTSVGGASITSGSGSVSSRAIGSDLRQYIVNLTGVTNAQTVTVSLTSVSDSAGSFSNIISNSMRVLVGDTSADGSVNSADIAQTKSQSGQLVTGSNFREDVTTDGNLNSGDIGLVKSKSGTALP